MKRNLFILAAMAVALVLVAFVGCESASAYELPNNVIGQGPTLKFTGLDTCWATEQQVVTAGATVQDFYVDDLVQRLYPIIVRIPKEGSDQFFEPRMRATLWVVEAETPFYWKGFVNGGDSLQVTQTYVDTVGFTGGVPHGTDRPCWTLIYAGLDTLRVTPTDSAFITPYVLKD